MRGVFLTHPVLAFYYFYFVSVFFFSFFLALIFCGEFLLHIPCLFDFSVQSFSYTSRAGFMFMQGVWVEAGPGEKCEKVTLNKLHSEERKEPYNTLNGKMKREKKKHSNAKEPYKSGKKNKTRNSH